MAQENIDVTVHLRNALSRPAREAADSVDDLTESVEKNNVVLEENADATGKAEAALEDHQEAVEAHTEAVDDNTSSVNRNRREQRTFTAETTRSERALKALRKATGGVGSALRLATKFAVPMRAALVGMLVVALVPFLYAAAGAIAALGAAAYAGVAALAPMVGLLASLPALLAGAGAGFAAIKVGFSGIGSALKVLNNPESSPEQIAEALNKLSPAGREFASTMSELKNQTDGWSKSISSSMLPGFTKLIQSLGPLLPIVERNLIKTGAAWGAMATQMSRVVKGSAGDVNTVMSNGTKMVQNGFAPALVSLVAIFRDLAVTGGPVMLRFTTWLGEATGRLERLVAAGRDSGGLVAFFERAGDRAAGFFAALKDLSIGLYNVGKESKVMGDAMGAGLAGAFADFRAWTESDAGKESIRQFFTDALPAVMELSRMVFGLMKAFGGLATSETLAPLLKQIRTELGPALGEMMSNLNTNLGPAVIDILTGLANMIAAIPVAPLTAVVQALGDLSLWLGELLKNNPGLATFAASLLFVAPAAKSALLLGAGFRKVASGVKMAVGAAKVLQFGFTAGMAAVRGTTAATVAFSSAAGRAATVGRFLGKAIRIVGLAMRSAFLTNPVAVILLAIAAVFVLLYRNSETFRNAVHAVGAALKSFGLQAWAVIKSVASAIGGVLTKVWGGMVTGFKAAWGVIRGVLSVIGAIFKGVFWVIKTQWEIVIGVVLIVFRALWAALKPIVTAIGAGFVAAWNLIKAGASILWGWLRTGFGVLRSALAAVWGAIRAAGVAVWRPIRAAAVAVWEGIKTGARAVLGVVVPVWNRIESSAQSAFNGLIRIVTPIIDTIESLFRGIGDTVRGVWDGLSAGLSSALDGVKGIINSVIRGVNKMIDGVNKVKVGDDIGHIPTLYTGGAVTAGMTAFVGELGSELFMPANGGLPRLIGAGGPELRTFSQPGYVVPNPTTPDALTNPLPAWVSSRLDRHAELPASEGRGTVAVAAPVEVDPNVHFHFDGGPPPLTVAEMEAAALRAYRRWQQEKKERG